VRRVVDPVAPPILLLHGLGVAGAVWQAFARRLLPHFAAVAPDLRGHGSSDAPPSGYEPLEYATDLVEMIGALIETPPLPVVGHSLGALVALELAHGWPHLVSHVVLLDPPLDASLPNPEVREVYRLRHAPDGELEAYLLERNPGGGQLLAQQLARMFRQAADAAFEAMLGRDDRAASPVVEQPTLVVQADPERGGLLGDTAAEVFLKRLPRGRLQKIAGATHSLHASHPADVAAAILGFCGGGSTRIQRTQGVSGGVSSPESGSR
jgi:pimeloyl-ACP methyl ester carboxylesterase